MSCPFDEDLSAFVAGDLDEARAGAVHLHLTGCADCRSLVALIRSTNTASEGDRGFEPSPQLRLAVAKSMDQQVRAQLAQSLRRIARWVFFILAAAVVLVVLLRR